VELIHRLTDSYSRLKMHVGSQIHSLGRFTPGKQSLLPTKYEALWDPEIVHMHWRRLLLLTGIEKRIQPLS